MKKQILAIAVLCAAFASCSKSDIVPERSIELLEGRTVIVQTTDTTFIMLAPMGAVKLPGKGLVLQNISKDRATLRVDGKVIEVKAGEVKK